MKKIAKRARATSDAGLARAIMMFHDLEGYFENTSARWKWMTPDSYQILVDEYGAERVDDLLKKYGKGRRDGSA